MTTTSKAAYQTALSGIEAQLLAMPDPRDKRDFCEALLSSMFPVRSRYRAAAETVHSRRSFLRKSQNTSNPTL